MTNFHTGQTVLLKKIVIALTGSKVSKYKVEKYNGPATLLYPLKDTKQWSVIFQDKPSNKYVIETFHESQLKPYKNKCWGHNCDGQIDSSIDSTCNVCHWVICPNCGRCKKTLCESSGFTIKAIPLKARLATK